MTTAPAKTEKEKFDDLLGGLLKVKAKSLPKSKAKRRATKRKKKKKRLGVSSMLLPNERQSYT